MWLREKEGKDTRTRNTAAGTQAETKQVLERQAGMPVRPVKHLKHDQASRVCVCRAKCTSRPGNLAEDRADAEAFRARRIPDRFISLTSTGTVAVPHHGRRAALLTRPRSRRHRCAPRLGGRVRWALAAAAVCGASCNPNIRATEHHGCDQRVLRALWRASAEWSSCKGVCFDRCELAN